MSCDDQVLFILKSHPRRKTSWIVIGMAVHQDQVSRFKFSKVVVQKILMAFRVFIKWVFIELAMLVACDKSSIPHITNHEIMSRSTAATEGNCLPGCIWFIIVQWQTVTYRATVLSILSSICPTDQAELEHNWVLECLTTMDCTDFGEGTNQIVKCVHTGQRAWSLNFLLTSDPSPKMVLYAEKICHDYTL